VDRVPDEKIAYILRQLSPQSHLTHFRNRTADGPYYPEFLDNLALIPSLTSLDLRGSAYYHQIDEQVVGEMKNVLINHASWMSTRLTTLYLDFPRSLLAGDMPGIELLGSSSTSKGRSF
jgi:hypothetical protein